MQRSAPSVISLSTETARVTRASSPDLSMASMNSRRLSNAIVQSADPAGQPFEADARKSCRREAFRQRFRFGEREHRLWQVGIGLSMFGHEPADGGENPAKIEEINRAQRRKPGSGKLQNHESCTRLQDASGFAQTAVDVGQVAHAKSH